MSNKNRTLPRLVIVLNPQAYGLEPKNIGSIVKTSRYILLLGDYWLLEDYLPLVRAVLIFNPMTKSARYVDLRTLVERLKNLSVWCEVYNYPVAKHRRQHDYLLVTTRLDDILLEMNLESRPPALVA